MITEDFVSYEVAKLLKEKGFQQLQDNCGYFTTEMIYSINIDNNGEHHFAHQYPDVTYCKDTYIAAPTLQMAMKWLREEHNILIVVDRAPEFYYWELEDNTTGEDIEGYGEAPTYEEACEEAIKYCLKNLI